MSNGQPGRTWRAGVTENNKDISSGAGDKSKEARGPRRDAKISDRSVASGTRLRFNTEAQSYE